MARKPVDQRAPDPEQPAALSSAEERGTLPDADRRDLSVADETSPQPVPTGVVTPKIVEHQASGHDVTMDERSLTGTQTTDTRSVLTEDVPGAPVAHPVRDLSRAQQRVVNPDGTYSYFDESGNQL